MGSKMSNKHKYIRKSIEFETRKSVSTGNWQISPKKQLNNTENQNKRGSVDLNNNGSQGACNTYKQYMDSKK